MPLGRVPQMSSEGMDCLLVSFMHATIAERDTAHTLVRSATLESRHAHPQGHSPTLYLPFKIQSAKTLRAEFEGRDASARLPASLEYLTKGF